MSEKSSNGNAITVVAAVIVVAALGAGGFFGFQELRKEFQAAQSETRSVIVDLNTEIVGKIDDIGGGGAGSGHQDIKTALEGLRATVDAVASQQVAMADALQQSMSADPGAMDTAPAEARAERDAADATESETVFFPTGKAAAPEVDEQIAAALATLEAYAGRPACFAQIHGYSDTVGNDDVNLKLSRERADYVSAKVRAAGIRVASVDGWGERRLDMHTFDGVDNSRNRRVVIDIACRDTDTKPTPTS